MKVLEIAFLIPFLCFAGPFMLSTIWGYYWLQRSPTGREIDIYLGLHLLAVSVFLAFYVGHIESLLEVSELLRACSEFLMDIKSH